MPTMRTVASTKKDILVEALAYLDLFYQERSRSIPCSERLVEIQEQIRRTGTYWHTPEELTYGAMVAWRNNTRCIGRLHWKTLIVRDRRHLSTARELFEEMVQHLLLATKGGKLRSMITVFAPQAPGGPGLRIWNPQLIRYAGYRQADGSCIGDPLHAELTAVIQHMGWKGAGTPFDLLPLVIQMPGQEPEVFELPREVVLEVPLEHPEFTWFADLGLKWHALPAISDMRLEIGGISYMAAPFNGWYVCTEIGARNLGDASRYNLLPTIANKMGLSTDSDRTFWKDQALLELNKAVLYSYAKRGVAMVDHHTASRQFVLHEEREGQAGRPTPADWGWIVPPISSSATPVFHRSYENVTLKPNFFYQQPPWRSASTVSGNQGCPFSASSFLAAEESRS